MHIVHAHIHTLKAALWFWQWIRGCCLEALLNHNNISNPLSLLCAGVWCVLLALNSFCWSEWSSWSYELRGAQKDDSQKPPKRGISPKRRIQHNNYSNYYKPNQSVGLLALNFKVSEAEKDKCLWDRCLFHYPLLLLLFCVMTDTAAIDPETWLLSASEVLDRSSCALITITDQWDLLMTQIHTPPHTHTCTHTYSHAAKIQSHFI